MSQKYSDEEALESASRFSYRKDWRSSDPRLCKAIFARNKDLYRRCVAHMRPAPNPFAGSYVIYAFEFSDGFAYVGLTYDIERRKKGHQIKGPVFNHIKCTGLDPILKILQCNIATPVDAKEAEAMWQSRYSAHWKPLHSASPGALGMGLVWTPKKLREDALRFNSKTEWARKSQGAYQASKRLAIFSECTAHMPIRKRSIKRKLTLEHREKSIMALRRAREIRWEKVKPT